MIQVWVHGCVCKCASQGEDRIVAVIGREAMWKWCVSGTIINPRELYIHILRFEYTCANWNLQEKIKEYKGRFC